MCYLCPAGSSFSIENLGSLQLGEMKTKMLLGSLTKLGKLRVHLKSGLITGYSLLSIGISSDVVP